MKKEYQIPQTEVIELEGSLMTGLFQGSGGIPR